MIYIKIPKDIHEYEAKVFSIFTFRQLMVISAALPFCYLSYKYAYPVLGKDLGSFVIMIPAFIAALFSWIKPYGMHFEKFLQSAFISNFLAPSKRLYKTENFYSSIQKLIYEEDVNSENPDSDTKVSKKKRTKKYKKSKRAFK